MTDRTADSAALRALVGGRAAPPDMRTLKAVHRGLVLLPTEPTPGWETRVTGDEPPELTVRRVAG